MTLNNLKHEADNIRLTSAESSAMRARIFGEGQSLESPELRTVLGRRSPYVFMSYHLRMTMAGLLLFVIAGTGTVSAAQGALPGDLLYPIKVSVNEKMEVALAPTPAARAQVQAKLAERRVDEAQTLASQGRLDKKTAETLTVDFDEHAAQAVALAEPDEQDEQVVEPTQVSIQTKMQVREENSAPRAASMMIQVAAEATTSPEQEIQSDKKSGKNRSEIRESLREKSDILRELKNSAPGIELQIGD